MSLNSSLDERAMSDRRFGTPAVPTTTIGYRAEIDGLRALAVLPVMLFHAGLDAFSGGFVGVDIFFVISGYLISTIILSELENGSFRFIEFYERRARRILPALFTVIVACLPLGWLWMTPAQLQNFSQSLVAVSLFASNILFWMEADYFAPAAEEKPLLHTWSLAVEEQFYIVAPLLLLAALRYSRRSAFWAVGCFGFVSLCLSQWMVGRYDEANFYLAPFRAWELFAGCLVAIIARGRGLNPRNGLAVLGLLAILVSIAAFDDQTPFPGVAALLPVGGTMLIILYGGKGSLIGLLLSCRPLVGVGLISYSAYLWHQPLFAFARIRLHETPSQIFLIALLVLSLLLAYMSWRFVERPFRQRDKIGKRGMAFATALFLLFPVLFGLVGQVTDGAARYRLTDHQQNTYSAISSSPKRQLCHASDQNVLSYDKSCAFFERQKTDVAVFGDSHAVELAFALAHELKFRGRGVRQLSYSDCPPSLGFVMKGREGCAAWTENTVSKLINDGEIRTVIVVYRIYAHLAGDPEGHYPALGDVPEGAEQDAMWRSFLSILEALTASGKQVIVVTQAPELPKHIGSLIMRQRQDSVELEGVQREWWNRRKAVIDNRIADIPDVVQVYDPTDLFCDVKRCLAASNGIPFYFDDDHLSVQGARLVAEEVSLLVN